MIAEFVNPSSKEVMKVEINDHDSEEIKGIYKPAIESTKLKQMIDNLSIPAEAKAILIGVADLTAKLGEVVINVGHKILEVIVFLIKSFPYTAAGTVVGAVIGMLISSIPVIGWLIGWLVFPLCTSLGLAVGFWCDIDNPELKSRIGQIGDQLFGLLKNIAVPV